jgi:hypothetical protein
MSRIGFRSMALPEELVVSIVDKDLVALMLGIAGYARRSAEQSR